MKFNLANPKEVVESFVCISCDISHDKLDFCSKLTINGKLTEIDGNIANREREIREMLLQIEALAKAAGIDKVMVACEPTGGYEKKLMRIAFDLNLCPCYVHSGHTKNATKITSNDPEKSDFKDCRTIYMIAADFQKTIPYRPLEKHYEQLRSYSSWYKEINDRIVELRCLIHCQLRELFCEFSRDNDYISDNVGRAIAKACGYDPRVIVKLGKTGFFKKVKKFNKYAQRKVLEQIYDEAKASLKVNQSHSLLDIYAERFKHTYDLWMKEIEQKEAISAKLEEIYRQTVEFTKLKGFVSFSDVQMARIIGETGPLSDFSSQRQLIRFAGLNLCRRQSGKYVGKTKISKCGRTTLRYVLYQSVWSCLKRPKSEIGTYYNNKKNEGCKNGIAMVAAMRKSLKIIFGAFSSREGYDINYLERYLAKAS